MPNTLEKLKELTENLKNPSSELDEIFSTSVTLLCQANFNGYFTRVSLAWTKALGWTEAEFCSKPWLDFVHPDDYEKTEKAGNDMRNGIILINFVNRYRCKDGSYRTILWNSPQFSPNGTSYVSGTDITEFGG